MEKGKFCKRVMLWTAIVVAVVAWLLAWRVAYLDRVIETNRGVLEIPEDYE